MLDLQAILHPTDFSEHSGHAFRLACSLARDYGARLVVLHVGEPPVLVTEGIVAPPLPAEYDRPDLEARLRKLTPPVPPVPVEYQLVFGTAAEQILAAAEAFHCGLIVMGTHGRTGLSRALLGSVAEQVARRAPCPVLTVKAPSPADAAGREIRQILHPTDFSERSQVALQFASWLARDHKARLILLHVVQPPAVAYGEILTEGIVDAEKAAAMQRLTKLTPTVPGVKFEHRLEEGDPAEQILHAAKAGPCDLVVLGTHGRTGLGRLVMGSVAELVVRKAPCPVLTVKAPFPQGPSTGEPPRTEVEAAGQSS
jgi:nucleotide-binding universal stress UspA family protein